MRALFTLMTVMALAFSALGFYAPAALAAAPGNDLSSGATAVSVGFSETLNTTEATTDAEDAQFNASCGAPATDASVWYTLVGNDSNVVIDVEGYDRAEWVLMDVFDFVVHVFTPDTRRFYALERLWGSAERVGFPDLDGPAEGDA